MRKYIKTVYRRLASDIKEYGMAAALLALYAVAVNLAFHAFCPVVIAAGFPCPGCGVTRAAACLLTGRWRQAWRLNPAVYPIAAIAVYFLWNRYGRGRKAAGLAWMIAAAAVLLVAVYAVRMYLYFPDRVPYVYREDNMLARMLPFYRHMLHEAGVL